MAFEAALGMERLCTIREIAQKAELGAATVHRALKNSREVRAETRRLVLETVCLLNEEKIARAARFVGDQSMMPKSVKRFSDDIMLHLWDLEPDDFRSNRPEIIRL